MDIWLACKDAAQPGPLSGSVIRVVQPLVSRALLDLVDDLQEQALLETLLEASRPQAQDPAPGLHELLRSPFRDPPLRYGSRFGTHLEPSLFYASASITTALAETAYYRFVFWAGMVEPPPGGRLTTELTVFAAEFSLQRGLQLQHTPWAEYSDRLRDPQHYRTTQALGRAMREAGIDGFEYISARDRECGLNRAFYTPEVFADPMPRWQEQWLCETRADAVSFFSKQHGACFYPLEDFRVDGALPLPAQ
ncbi:MAG: RES family NAD+ phosphorylase [Candidatus Thiodiazotropha sp.]